MNKQQYQEGKQAARDQAIRVQIWLSGNRCSYGTLLEIQVFLEKIGRKYGLIREFQENGLL